MKKLMTIIPFIFLASCASHQSINEPTREDIIKEKYAVRAKQLHDQVISDEAPLIVEKFPETKKNYDEFIKKSVEMYPYANFARVNTYCSNKCSVKGYEELLRIDHNKELDIVRKKEYEDAIAAIKHDRYIKEENARTSQAEGAYRLSNALRVASENFKANSVAPVQNKRVNCQSKAGYMPGVVDTTCF